MLCPNRYAAPENSTGMYGLGSARYEPRPLRRMSSTSGWPTKFGRTWFTTSHW